MLEVHKCRITAKPCSIGKLNGYNGSASTHGGPQSPTKSSAINCPILPSRLWNVFLLFCFTFALGPPLLFACLWLIFTDKPPLKTVQLPERKLPLSVCLSVDDLAHCCPRCSGFLFHLSYDYGVLITSLTNDVDWHHYIVVLAGSLGMLIKEADVSLAAQSSRIVNMRWSYSLKLERQTLFTRTLYMMFLFEHWIRREERKLQPELHWAWLLFRGHSTDFISSHSAWRLLSFCHRRFEHLSEKIKHFLKDITDISFCLA